MKSILLNIVFLFSFLVSNNWLFAQTVQSYSYTGSVQNFVVPTCVQSITIKCWGAGGHKGGQDTYNGASGGGGAFTQTTLSVTPGQSITIIVGGAGALGTNCASSAPGGIGGWGNGLLNGARGGNAGSQGCSGGGGGGGAGSGVYFGTTALAIAGGGGGGSGGGNQSAGAAGGGGGQNGFTVSGCNQGFTNSSSNGNGTQGGDRGNADGAGGGGGGGGRFGGTGGSAPTGCDCGGCGGGGGANFASGTGNILTNGNGINPANSTDIHYQSGVGNGGTASQNAGNGLVVILYNQPVVTAAFQTNLTCLGSTTLFTNTSSATNANLNSYTWDFGDGTPLSNSVSPSHSYTAIGTYTVTLSINSDVGCSNSITGTITVFPQPSASFSLDNTCKDSGSPMILTNTSQFANSSTDQITWSSTDGFSSNNLDFNHVFDPQGTYDVTLTIASTDGCNSSFTQSVNYFNNPTAISTINDICDGNPLNLISESSGFAGQSLTHSWIVNGEAPVLQASYNYPYNSPGTYQIQLIATTGYGCSDTLDEFVTIFPSPVASFSIPESCAESLVQIINQSTVNTGSTYFWSVNGTLQSTDSNFSFTFPNGGNYAIELFISEDNSSIVCSSSIIQNVFIHGVPQLSVQGDFTICAGEVISANNVSTVTPDELLNFSWLVNGIEVSTAQNFSQPFSIPGSYSLELVVTSDFGCTASSIFPLVVNVIPSAPSLSVNEIKCIGDEAILMAVIEPQANVTWSGPQNFTSVSSSNSLSMSVPQMGVYSAFQTSAEGCVSPVSFINVVIQNIYSFNDFDFPNVITPNGDGVNEDLNIDSYFQTCDTYTITICNRWGNEVYKFSTGEAPFAGKTMDGNDLVPGVYFYKLEFFSGGEEKAGEKSGFIQLIR